LTGTAPSTTGLPRPGAWLRDKAEAIAVIASLSAGAVLRLGWAGVSSFGYDEARVSDLALQMARQGRLATLGMPSSTGIPNFPAAVWLYALPYAISTDPQVAVWFTSLVNVLAILGMWWLGRQAWGKWAGVAAAWLFATSPWLVFYGRSVWSQNWLAPLAVLWAATAVAGIGHNRRHSGLWLAGHAFLAGFVGQVHPAGIALALASLWIGLRFRLWRRWRAIVAGAGLALLAALPTVYTIWFRAPGVRSELARLLAQEASFRWDSLRQLGRLGAGIGWEAFWLNAQWAWPQPLAAALRLGQALLGVGILAGGLTVAWAMLRRRSRPDAGSGQGTSALAGFVLAWAGAAALLFLWSKTPAYIQYQLACLPALFLCAAAWVGSRPGQRWRRLWLAVLLAIGLLQSVAVGLTLSHVGQTYVPGGLGTPLRYPHTAANELAADGRPIVVETFGGEPAYYGDAAVFHVLLWGRPHQLVDARAALIVPAEPAHILFTFDDLPAWEVAQQVGLAGAVRQFPRRQGEPPYWAIDTLAAQVAGFTPVMPVRLANGATLLGWQLRELAGGRRWRLISHWQISAPQAGRFHQFNHLYVVGNPSPAAVSDAYVSSESWQDGDHLITWAEFEKPQEQALYFHVGMYTWPQVERVPRLDHDGDPLAPIQLDVH